MALFIFFFFFVFALFLSCWGQGNMLGTLVYSMSLREMERDHG